ncbi:MAG: hypothetical protein F6J97_23720 [Leptolyngbya sp. SIO4C1]|nr:hypothetical protein [Leptolyngbya sp. SIO4C1]
MIQVFSAGGWARLWVAALVLLAGCTTLPDDLAESDAASSSGDAALEAGIVAYEAGDFETAAAQVEQALAAGMTDYSLDQAHTVLGNIYRPCLTTSSP